MQIKRRFFSLIMTAVCIVLCACGLSVYYVLEPPYDANVRTDTDIDSECYFHFTTADSANTDVEGYKGTSVYYKIYNNSAVLSSQVNSIKTTNKKYSDAGFKKLSTYSYKPMSIKFASDYGTVIPDQGVNTAVSIRLITEGYIGTDGSTSYTYDKGITIDGDNYGYVYRSNSKEFTTVTETYMNSLSLGDNGEIYKSSEDDDDTVTDGWYIAAFAVSNGWDTTYTPFYSEVEYLGYLYLQYDNFKD